MAYARAVTPVFAQVQAILAGAARTPLADTGTKLLYYMLERHHGCDVTVTPERFYIQYGWHTAHHRYVDTFALQVVSWLCDAAPTGYLPAGSLPWWFEASDTSTVNIYADGTALQSRYPLEPRWAYGARRIWIDRAPDSVVLRVRDATIDPGAASIPTPIEPPIEYLPGAHPCPHCGIVPERYRKLGGSVVCLACGASSRAQ
jgi:hypothetical protein